MPKLIKSNTNGTKEEYQGKSASAGVGDAGEFVTLDATGKLDPTVFPANFGADALQVTAGEALTAGDFVYIDSSGNALKSDASNIAKIARGYVKSNVANAAQATVFFDDDNAGLSGLTAGTTYYLSSTTPGAVTTTVPTTADQVVQVLGFAINATTLHVDIQENPLIRK